MIGNLIGMVLPSWAKWAAIGVAVLAVALWIGILKGQVSHYKGKVAELEAWQAQAIAAGKAAEAEAKRKEQAYAENIKKASASAARARADLDRWVREHGAGGSVLPRDTGAPQGTSREGQLCFDRAQLDRALQQFRADVAGLVAEGQQAVIDRKECVAGWPR